MSQNIVVMRYQTSCGQLLLGQFSGRLCLCDWVDSPHHQAVVHRLTSALDASIISGSGQVIESAIEQLDEYFAHTCRRFSLPLLFVGTEFQQCVWRQLLAVPYGGRISYSGLARQLSADNAVRAVAGAVGANALSIVVPCHRVIGADGSLTGYAGGLRAKRFLLRHEAT